MAGYCATMFIQPLRICVSIHTRVDERLAAGALLTRRDPSDSSGCYSVLNAKRRIGRLRAILETLTQQAGAPEPPSAPAQLRPDPYRSPALLGSAATDPDTPARSAARCHRRPAAQPQGAQNLWRLSGRTHDRGQISSRHRARRGCLGIGRLGDR